PRTTAPTAVPGSSAEAAAAAPSARRSPATSAAAAASRRPAAAGSAASAAASVPAPDGGGGRAMQRLPQDPRPDRLERARRMGFAFAEYEGEPYWDESAYYRFTADEVDTLEEATAELEARMR